MNKLLTAYLAIGLSLSCSVAHAEVIVAEDFLYAQPTKAFGPGGGFTRQDYGGGQNGAAGQWLGRWVSVGDGIITGPDISEETFNLETDVSQGLTRNGLSVNWLERDFQMNGLANDQTVYFGATMRSSDETAQPNASFTINDAAGEDQVGFGFTQGGFRALLGVQELAEGEEPDGVVPGPELTDGLDPHRLIGKFEVNATGSDERLTVWLDPTGVETAEHSVELTGNIVDGLSDFQGNLRLDHVASSGLMFWDDLALGTTWEAVASVDVPRMTLQVDTDSRELRFTNTTDSDLEVTFVEVESPGGRGLTEQRWNSLADQGVEGWQENNPSASRFTESNFAGALQLASGAHFGWGQAFSKRDEDLVGHIGTSDGLLNVTNVVYGPIIDETADTDFDNSGATDVADIDLLCTQIAQSTNDVAFDLTGDGAVNEEDLADFLGQVGSLAGDANLDGKVDFPDFLSLSANFNQSERTWSQGDVDCNATVAFADFLLLSTNFNKSGVAAAAAVPEPSTALLMIVGMLCFCRRATRRS